MTHKKKNEKKRCIIFVIVTVLWVAKFLPLFLDYFSSLLYTQNTKHSKKSNLYFDWHFACLSLGLAYRVSLTSSLSAIYIVIHASKIFAPFFCELRCLVFVSYIHSIRSCGSCQFHGSLRRSAINQWRFFFCSFKRRIDDKKNNAILINTISNLLLDPLLTLSTSHGWACSSVDVDVKTWQLTNSLDSTSEMDIFMHNGKQRTIGIYSHD